MIRCSGFKIFSDLKCLGGDWLCTSHWFCRLRLTTLFELFGFNQNYDQFMEVIQSLNKKLWDYGLCTCISFTGVQT
jgi:hypothetical protein